MCRCHSLDQESADAELATGIGQYLAGEPPECLAVEIACGDLLEQSLSQPIRCVVFAGDHAVVHAASGSDTTS